MTTRFGKTERLTSSWAVAAALFVALGFASMSFNDTPAPTGDVIAMAPISESVAPVADPLAEPVTDTTDVAVLDTEGFAPPQN